MQGPSTARIVPDVRRRTSETAASSTPAASPRQPALAVSNGGAETPPVRSLKRISAPASSRRIQDKEAGLGTVDERWDVELVLHQLVVAHVELVERARLVGVVAQVHDPPLRGRA